MSHYSSKANMLTRFREQELIDLTNKAASTSTGAIVDSIIAEALHDAESLMDSYFATAGYVTPVEITPVPEILTRISCDLARWFLYTRSGTEVKDTEPRLRYEDALKWLEKVADGDLTIRGAEREEEGTYAGVAASTKDIVFTSTVVAKMDVSEL